MTHPRCALYTLYLYIYDVFIVTRLVRAVSGCERPDWGCAKDYIEYDIWGAPIKEMLPPNGLKPHYYVYQK